MHIQQEQLVALIAAILMSGGNVEPGNAVLSAHRLIEIAANSTSGKPITSRLFPHR
jgi:hypothetical protein